MHIGTVDDDGGQGKQLLNIILQIAIVRLDDARVRRELSRFVALVETQMLVEQWLLDKLLAALGARERVLVLLLVQVLARLRRKLLVAVIALEIDVLISIIRLGQL